MHLQQSYFLERSGKIVMLKLFISLIDYVFTFDIITVSKSYLMENFECVTLLREPEIICFAFFVRVC